MANIMKRKSRNREMEMKKEEEKSKKEGWREDKPNSMI